MRRNVGPFCPFDFLFLFLRSLFERKVLCSSGGGINLVVVVGKMGVWVRSVGRPTFFFFFPNGLVVVVGGSLDCIRDRGGGGSKEQEKV